MRKNGLNFVISNLMGIAFALSTVDFRGNLSCSMKATVMIWALSSRIVCARYILMTPESY